MNGLLVLVIAGFTGLFSLIGLRQAQKINATPNLDPNHLLFSADEFLVFATIFGIATIALLGAAVALFVTNRR